MLGGPQNLMDALFYSQMFTDSFGFEEGAGDQCDGQASPCRG